MLVAAFALWILSYFEHNKNVRPSSIISAYLLLTLPLDAAHLRTRWLRGGDNITGNRIAVSILVLKLVITISESREKQRILSAPYTYLSPESTSGLLSRGFFCWLNPLFQLGSRRIVKEDDLFAVDEDLLSSVCEMRFKRYWENCMSFFLYNQQAKADPLDRYKISQKPHSILGHVAGNVKAFCSISCATPGIDIL